MLQMGNLAPRTRPLPGAHGGSAQGPSPLQAVLGALGAGRPAPMVQTLSDDRRTTSNSSVAACLRPGGQRAPRRGPEWSLG